MKEIDDFQKIESIALYEHQIVIVLALKHEKEKLEPKFEDPNLQYLLNEIKKLLKRHDDVEHLLFYQKPMAISTISNFSLLIPNSLKIPEIKMILGLIISLSFKLMIKLSSLKL